MSSTVASDTYRERVLNVFVNFEQFKEDYEEFRSYLITVNLFASEL